MGEFLFLALLAVVVLLAAFSVYLFVRILRVYRKARRLEVMRGYETIMYAALQKLSPRETLDALLPDHDPRVLEDVLLRMGDEGAEGWKDKVVELYGLAGFTRKRVEQLRSPRRGRRSDAARRLGRICDPGAVPALRGLLGDKEEEVREAALYALGRIGTLEALEAMLEALERGNRWTQEKIAEVIQEAGDESIAVLVDLLRDPNPARRAFAAEVIGGVAGADEVGYLAEALMDDDLDVRARAADSLGKLRHPSSRPSLLLALEDPQWEVRAQAAKALGRIGEEEDAPRLAEKLRDPQWWVRNNAAAALREMGESGEGSLVGALWDEDRFAREAAAQALEEGSLVERIIEEMREGGSGTEGERILRRLAELGCAGTISQVLDDLEDEALLNRLALVLADLDDPDSSRLAGGKPGLQDGSGPPARGGRRGGEGAEGAATAEDGESGG